VWTMKPGEMNYPKGRRPRDEMAVGGLIG